jgi:uncharacterized protein (TIGR00290 family)
MTEVVVSWSGGKDSALALYEMQRAGTCRVAALLTTVTRDYDRISMHGVRRVLLQQQADALGIPLHEVFISKEASNEEYETQLSAALDQYQTRGITEVVFGDLFLEDIKTYRDQFLSTRGMTGIYPIWQWDTAATVRRFIELGFKAVVTCVDGRVLDGKFAGMTIDLDFLEALPATVDPCGENGEFHTFVYDGPNVAQTVPFTLGESVGRGPFYFRDLVPNPHRKG